jgi:hypothetical protein
MNTIITSPRETDLPSSAIHSGDYIQVRLPGGTVITAYVIAVAHGPGHADGGSGVDWESCALPAGALTLLRGHAEYAAADTVTRVYAAPVPGVAA